MWRERYLRSDIHISRHSPVSPGSAPSSSFGDSAMAHDTHLVDLVLVAVSIFSSSSSLFTGLIPLPLSAHTVVFLGEDSGGPHNKCLFDPLNPSPPLLLMVLFHETPH
jgi:hypothetical protein